MKDPDRADRIMILVWALLAIGLTGLAISDFVAGSWIIGLTQLVFAAAWTFFAVLRRQWIKIGRRRGRSEMFRSLEEAARRGLTFEDWFALELERDAVALGLFPLPPKTEDD